VNKHRVFLDFLLLAGVVTTIIGRQLSGRLLVKALLIIAACIGIAALALLR
jgi:hypothetical protein